jgi:hypothetical protein
MVRFGPLPATFAHRGASMPLIALNLGLLLDD